MNHMLIFNYLFAEIRSGKNMTVKVSGTIMLPTMSDGDLVTVCQDNSYSIGDILVLIYKGTYSYCFS